MAKKKYIQRRLIKAWTRQVAKILNISRHRVRIRYSEKSVDVLLCDSLALIQVSGRLPKWRSDADVVRLIELVARMVDFTERDVGYIFEFWVWKDSRTWEEMFPATTWSMVKAIP